MVEKLTGLTHRIAIRLYLVAESCTIHNSCSRWPVQKLGYTLISELPMNVCWFVM